MENRDVAVIMPALNEEDNIENAIQDVLSAFNTLNINGELIVINDGSTDHTKEIVEEKMKSESLIRLINHEKPKGIGNAFWTGVDASPAKAVCMLPGDNENEAMEILRYYPLLDHVDIVVPFIFNRQVRPFFRNILSLIYRLIINTTFLVNFNYTNGTVFYRRSLLKELSFRSSGFFYQTDILVRLVKKGYIFAEVPYRLRTREKGKSKAISFPSLYNVMKGYFHLVKDIYYNGSNSKNTIFIMDSQTAIRSNRPSTNL
ncbi:MAG: glycosyltransferase family 2 protein [Desulfobacterales bacterium]|nr:glycosyltransferase family 2 protein [Desulfobacterales bacterium]